MNGLGKRIGYLKGLMEGMDFSNDPSREKLFNAIADLLGELCDRVESMEELMDDLNDYVESIDDDLALLESGQNGLRFTEGDEEDDDYLDDLAEGEDQLHLLNSKGGDEEEDVQTLTGAICPECKKMFFVNADDPEDAVYACPHCAQRVTPEPLTPKNAPIAKPE